MAILPAHGTINRYVNYGCRCKDCKTANRLYARKWRAAAKRKSRRSK